MKTIKLGANGPEVAAIGLGSLSMGKSGPFGASNDDDAFAVTSGRAPAQVCYAWVLAKQPAFVPLAGARTPAQLDVLDVLARPFSTGETTELEALLPKGAFQCSRYPAAQMAMLDRER